MQPELFLAKSRGCHQECRFYSSLRFDDRINVYFEWNLPRRMLFNVGNEEIKKQSCFYSLKPVFFHLQRRKLHTTATFFTSSACHVRHTRVITKQEVSRKGIHARWFWLHMRSSVMNRRNFPAEWPQHVTQYSLCAAMFTVNLNLFSSLRHPSTWKSHENFTVRRKQRRLWAFCLAVCNDKVFSKK